jgi:hypothetical protein
MKWIEVSKEFPPENTPILVKYISGNYDVLEFKHDSEYGFVASTFESYVAISNIEKWTKIED